MNEVITAAITGFWLILDFIAACIVSAWHDDYERHLKQETDEQRQDEQRRS
jgi:hypothetical protein